MQRSVMNATKQSGLVSMLFGLAVGLCLFVFHVIGFGFEYFPGDLGDGRLNLYFLEHAHRFFTGDVASLWNAPFMYPEPKVMSYSDTLLGSAPFYSLFRLLGFGTYTAYQLWFVVVSSLNYICAFYFLKYLFKNNYAAVLGAFVLAFSIAIQSQLTHAQTFPRFAIPLALWMAVKFSEDLKPKYFFYTLCFVVYQIYCGIYLGFMLAIPTGIYLFMIVLKDILGERKAVLNFKWYLKVCLAGVVSVLMLLPLMLPYMDRKIEPTMEYYRQISGSIPTLLSHFYSQQGSLLWDSLSQVGKNLPASWDHQLYTGAFATVCLLVAFFVAVVVFAKSRFRIVKLSSLNILLLAGLAMLLLYLRFGNISAYILVYHLPGFSSMRSVTRIINVELIFFALAIAFVYVELLSNKFKSQAILFIVCFGLIISDNYFYADKSYKTLVSVAEQRTQPLSVAFASIPKNSIVSYEPDTLTDAPHLYQIDAMMASQAFVVKVINAYTATCPGDYGPYWNHLNESSRMHWLADRDIETDTLYVVKNAEIIQKIPRSVIANSELKIKKQKERLEGMMDYIRSDKAWMEQIQQKALDKNISVDSMLVLDALWSIEHQ